MLPNNWSFNIDRYTIKLLSTFGKTNFRIV